VSRSFHSFCTKTHKPITHRFVKILPTLPIGMIWATWCSSFSKCFLGMFFTMKWVVLSRVRTLARAVSILVATSKKLCITLNALFYDTVVFIKTTCRVFVLNIRNTILSKFDSFSDFHNNLLLGYYIKGYPISQGLLCQKP